MIGVASSSGGSAGRGGPARRGAGRPAAWRPAAGPESPSRRGDQVVRSRWSSLRLSPARKSFSAASSRRRGDAAAAQGALVLGGEVGQEREVVVLGAPLHAELVIEAAVALVGEMKGDVVEGLAEHLVGGGVRAGDEVRAPPAGRRPGPPRHSSSVVQAEEGSGPLCARACRPRPALRAGTWPSAGRCRGRG